MTISSEDCVAHAEPEAFEAEDTVWFGGMFPVTEVPAFVDESWAAELAREDFAQALGPSAERTGALHARPIGLLVCDEVVDAMRAARHMVDDVEVPAVIGFRSTKKALTTIPSVFLPNHVLSFISISQAAAVTKIPEPAGEPRLIWRSTLNHAAAAEPLAHLISDVLEPASRSAQRDLGKRPFRVAILLPKAANPDIAQSFFAVLRFNDRSALENGANFRQVIYEPRVKGGADDAIAELLAFSPNVIVVAGGPDPFTEVLMPLEARWSSSARPFYLAESGFPVHPVAELVGHDPALRRRFLSATNLSTTMTNAQLVLRYNLAFPAEPVSRSNAPQPSYDAFYLLAYAAYALGDGRISGTQLSGAIARLVPPGRRVDVGPTQIFEAFAALRAPEGRMDLNGAIGALDFDPSTGEAPIDYAITCPGVDDQGVASAGIDSGLVFDSRAKKLIGVLRCP